MMFGSMSAITFSPYAFNTDESLIVQNVINFLCLDYCGMYDFFFLIFPLILHHKDQDMQCQKGFVKFLRYQDLSVTSLMFHSTSGIINSFSF